jgi:hypothetical protein
LSWLDYFVFNARDDATDDMDTMIKFVESNVNEIFSTVRGIDVVNKWKAKRK